MLFKPRINRSLPPAILLGGGANALSVARNLRRQGIEVIIVGDHHHCARFSRFCRWVALPGSGDIGKRWFEWLTNEEGRQHRGAALIACGDDALEFVVHYRSALADYFLITEANDDVLAAMLDKARTHELAKRAGIPAPEVWIVSTRDDLRRVMEQVTYPCGLKPRVSHVFKNFTDKKLLVANDAYELMSAFEKVEPFKVEMMVTELIPGGDRGYCSYYSYLDERGEPLFHFTKRKLRQYPNGFGSGTFHVTDWNPEVAELGLRFFQRIGLRGLACVEFKRDPRDGALKLIECNHRFTEPNELLTRAGIDLATLTYNRLTKRPLPPLASYRKGICLVKPWEDILAFRQLHKKGELSWSEWVISRAAPTSFLYFKWWDPVPWVFQLYLYVLRQTGKVRAWRAHRSPAAVVGNLAKATG